MVPPLARSINPSSPSRSPRALSPITHLAITQFGLAISSGLPSPDGLITPDGRRKRVILSIPPPFASSPTAPALRPRRVPVCPPLHLRTRLPHHVNNASASCRSRRACCRRRDDMARHWRCKVATGFLPFLHIPSSSDVPPHLVFAAARIKGHPFTSSTFVVRPPLSDSRDRVVNNNNNNNRRVLISPSYP